MKTLLNVQSVDGGSLGTSQRVAMALYYFYIGTPEQG